MCKNRPVMQAGRQKLQESNGNATDQEAQVTTLTCNWHRRCVWGAVSWDRAPEPHGDLTPSPGGGQNCLMLQDTQMLSGGSENCQAWGNPHTSGHRRGSVRVVKEIQGCVFPYKSNPTTHKKILHQKNRKRKPRKEGKHELEQMQKKHLMKVSIHLWLKMLIKLCKNELSQSDKVHLQV